jgi:uncharacterized protein YkwD
MNTSSGLNKKQEINYDSLAKQVIDEHNKIRTDPSSYIEKLHSCLSYFRGEKLLHKPGEEAIETYEGKPAFEEAIDFLKRQKPIGALKQEERLIKACRDHIADIGPSGLASHESSDGRNVSDRIERYAEWDGACTENIDFGTKLAEDIIINFLVDDGIPERLQRKNLFNPELKYIGVASGEHKEFLISTVVNYVAGIRNLGESSPDTKNFISEYLKQAEDTKLNPNKPKNMFQEDDPDAPANTLSVKIIKTTKIIKGKPKKITRKIYSLDDNTQHIVEIEDS